jgi:hypothetical protein
MVAVGAHCETAYGGWLQEVIYRLGGSSFEKEPSLLVAPEAALRDFSTALLAGTAKESPR